jgi:uncharacterized protein (TIGR03435 family)
MIQSHKKNLARAIGLLAAVPIALGLLIATPSPAQSQKQITTANAPTYEYEAATIEPSKGPGPYNKIGVWDEPDGFNAWYVTPQQIISIAYGVERFRILGGPGWLPSERFDIEAKMDASVAEALRKLSPDQRSKTWEQMLQALLADRLKLVVHRETKELPVYNLVVAKGGPKLQEAKPGDTYPNSPNSPDGTHEGAGSIWERSDGAGVFQAISSARLARLLTAEVGRPVIDMTGLKGTYDFTLMYTPDDRLQPPSGADPKDRPPPAPSDANAPSLFDALPQQLGLKLESGKGPLEIIVIDHVERPSGN